MYSEQLEALIKNVLADGVITDKERAVLHKKAEAEGIDVDEIDVYIDGELDKIRNEQMKAKAQVRKCPACGEIIPALSNVCPSCGAVINNPKGSDLQLLINNINNNLTEIKTLSSEIRGRFVLEGGYDNLQQKIIKLIISTKSDIQKANLLYKDNQKVINYISELEKEILEIQKEVDRYKTISYVILAIGVFTPFVLTLIISGDFLLALLMGIVIGFIDFIMSVIVVANIASFMCWLLFKRNK